MRSFKSFYSRVFREEWLDAVPYGWRADLRSHHDEMLAAAEAIPLGSGARCAGERAANRWLAGIAEKLHSIGRYIAADEFDIREISQKMAAAMMDAARRCVGGIEAVRRELDRLSSVAGVSPPDMTI
ncbi:MAG: hypothetical protein LBF51_11310, partial [Zoogloeaceae bacterium]|jgi:hypothetical protein|nr:hypothetical protein [Zoogloeaceae bacterium]